MNNSISNFKINSYKPISTILKLINAKNSDTVDAEETITDSAHLKSVTTNVPTLWV